MVMQTGCNMLHIIYREGMVNPHEEGGSGQFLRVGKGGGQMHENKLQSAHCICWKIVRYVISSLYAAPRI